MIVDQKLVFFAHEWKACCLGIMETTMLSSSTTKVEYVAKTTITKEVIWLCKLLGCLGFSQKTPTYIF
jgi:hypothetical protein